MPIIHVITIKGEVMIQQSIASEWLNDIDGMTIKQAINYLSQLDEVAYKKEQARETIARYNVRIDKLREELKNYQ